MTDVHSHIIYGIDDGSHSIEETIELLKKMEEVGFQNVIATPHYIEKSEYDANNKEKIKRLEVIRDAIKKEGLKINVYLGNEIYVNDHISDLIKNGEVYTLNNTKYLLFEIPFRNRILNVKDIIHEIKMAGYIPILAHPERYIYFQDDYKLVDELKAEDVLFQSNFGSLTGYYGHRSLKLLKYMLKRDYVDYLGTDIHHLNKDNILDNFEVATKKFTKILGQEKFNQILANADRLIKEESN